MNGMAGGLLKSMKLLSNYILECNKMTKKKQYKNLKRDGKHKLKKKINLLWQKRIQRNKKRVMTREQMN